MAETSHYFDADPAAALETRSIRVELAGKERDVVTANAVFAGSRLDRGTAILLRETPSPPTSGNALDLGCGWGPIALSLALQAPELQMWALDVNQRALSLVRENARRLGIPHLHAVTAEGVPADLEFDTIWSNPPIRIGKPALHALLQAWLPRLRPGGTAWLVVAKQLGGDSLQRFLAESLGEHFSVTRATTDKGFRILRVERFAQQ